MENLKRNFLYSKNELKNDLCSFINFLKNNKLTVILCWFFLLLSYGIKLFWYSIGIDTEIMINSPERQLFSWGNIDRFGAVLVKKILRLSPFNPYAANFLMICAMFLFLMLLSFIFYSISNKFGNTPKCVFILPCVFITHPLFSEQFNFTLQAFEVSFAIALMFLSVFFITKWVFDSRNVIHLTAGIIFLAWAFWNYQSIVFLYISAALAVFVFTYVNNLKNPREGLNQRFFRRSAFNYIITFFCSYFLYFVVNKIAKYFNHSGSATYLSDMISWGKVDTKERILNILGQVFRSKKIVLLASMALVALILFLLFSKKIYFIFPYVAVSVLSVGFLAGSSRLIYCSATFTLTIACIYFLHFKSNKNRLLIAAAILGLIISPFILSIYLGHRCLPRSQFSLQFVLAFALFFLVQFVTLENKAIVYSKILMVLVVISSLGISFAQSYKTSCFLYYEYMKYQGEVALANKISERIDTLNANDISDTPVVFVGKMESSVVPENMKGNVLSRSFFEWGVNSAEITGRALGFMETIGYKYKFPTEEEFARARKIAETMPRWPNSGAVKYEDGVIIVKLSNN